MNAEGLYSAKVLGGLVTQGKPPKLTETMVVDLEVTHFSNKADPDADDSGWVSLIPMKKRTFLYMSEGAWPFTEEKLKKLEFNGDFDNPSFGVTECIVQCKHDTYEGKPSEKWEIYAERTYEKAGKDVLRKLRAKWTQSNKPAGKPAAPKAKAPEPGPDAALDEAVGLPPAEPSTVAMNADGELAEKAAPTGDKIPF